MSSDNAESTTITDTQPAQIKVHRDAWGQKELLETIVSRHFVVNSELGERNGQFGKLTNKTILMFMIHWIS
ncbi:MAG: hypothetical protein CM15mP3_08970 [Candidatus Poseidoniales archaeon]|nr:MAG: hypothetical protein CM15mP3_08970 [Candidatus Poseidoniales archaeon]